MRNYPENVVEEIKAHVSCPILCFRKPCGVHIRGKAIPLQACGAQRVLEG
jgi:hypothetical protein